MCKASAGAAAALLLASCTVTEGEDDRSAAAASPPNGGAATASTGSPDPVKDPAGPLPPAASRDPADLVRGCSGMNPEWRPRGSNCYGIFPEQCGADIAARHVGETMTPALAARMEEFAPGGARIIRPGQAVTEDLRYARLNVILNQADRITEVDCY